MIKNTWRITERAIVIKSIEFNSEEIKQMLEKAQEGLKFLEKKEQLDCEKIDGEVDRIIKNVQK